MPRRMRLLVALAVALTASSATAQNIGIFFDPSGAQCSGPVVQGTSTRLYILAVTGGPASGGIVVGEFRVVGLPAGWLVNAVPNPLANIQIGDPFGPVGTDLAFPVCQTGPVVLLFTVDLVATTSVTDHYLRIAQRNPPTNQTFHCPVVVLCDSPTFTSVCSTGGEAILNPTGPGCTVAAVPTSWTQVKGLYDRP